MAARMMPSEVVRDPISGRATAMILAGFVVSEVDRMAVK
jgi:hypothetical protein